MIYVVSGMIRCGTSMMMYGGETGGLEVLKSPERDVWATKFRDKQYDPNSKGLFELLPGPRKRLVMDPAPHAGKLVKVLYNSVLHFRAGDYRIVFMEREYEEIRQSFLAFFNKPIRLTETQYHCAMTYTKGILRQRRDVDLVEWQYRDVVENAVAAFGSLDWPIDVSAAASVVDPTQCRYRVENLTVGVR